MAEYIIEDNGWIENGGYVRPAPSGWVPPKPIVRCRDCEYYEEHSGEHWCTQHDIMTLKDMSDGFCKWGERR